MIGIFDSGFGGLTVLSGLLKELPEYNFIYLGDNARAPYGDKPQESIYRYTCAAVDFLFSQACELVIIACNTASAKSLRRIQQEHLPGKYPGKRVLGVIIPTVEELSSLDLTAKNIGLIGTRATIDSGTYEKELSKRYEGFNIKKTAAPLLVPLVESGLIDDDETKRIISNYLDMIKKDLDFLILGCTHYSLFENSIRLFINKKTRIIDTPSAVSKKLAAYLKRHPEIDRKLDKKKQLRIFTTGSPELFDSFKDKFFPHIKTPAVKVRIAGLCRLSD